MLMRFQEELWFGESASNRDAELLKNRSVRADTVHMRLRA